MNRKRSRVAGAGWKRLLMLTTLLLIAIPSLAYTGLEAVEYVKNYKPYSNSDDNVISISAIYAKGVFYEPNLKQILCDKPSGEVFIVTFLFSVEKPRPEVLIAAPALSQDEIMKVEDELRLEWSVDMDNKQVEPYNYFAQDSLNLYQETMKVLGTTLEEKK